MPIIRSQHTMEQYEEALQKMSHEIPEFREVRSDTMTIHFYENRISVQMHKPTGRKTSWGGDEVDYWSFTLERKNYTNSNHVTKISVSEENAERYQRFMEELMKGIPIVPRFSLEKVHLTKTTIK